MPEEAKFERSRWLRDLLRFLPLKSQFVLSGNVRDLQLAEVVTATVTPQPLLQTLAIELRRAGYSQVLAYEPMTGFRALTIPGEDGGASDALMRQLGLTPGQGGAAPAGVDLFADAAC